METLETWQVFAIAYVATLGVIIYAMWRRPNRNTFRKKWSRAVDNYSVTYSGIFRFVMSNGDIKSCVAQTEDKAKQRLSAEELLRVVSVSGSPVTLARFDRIEQA